MRVMSQFGKRLKALGVILATPFKAWKRLTYNWGFSPKLKNPKLAESCQWTKVQIQKDIISTP